MNQDTPKTSLEPDQSVPWEVQDPNSPTSSSITTISPQTVTEPVEVFLDEAPYVPVGNIYTNEQRKQACQIFVIAGTAKAIHEQMGIPIRTIYGWIKSAWWPRFLDDAKRDHQEILEARYSDILEQATKQLLDRIEHGDTSQVYDKERHKVVTLVKPVSAKELGNIVGVLSDRLRTIRGQPSRYTVEAKFNPEDITRKFAELAEKHRGKLVSES